MSAGALRTEMPEIATWIDHMRAAFGAPEINEAMKAGMRGQGTFWAKKGDREVGSRPAAGEGVCPTIFPPLTSPLPKGRRETD